MERKLQHLRPPSSEITPLEVYLSRREWLKMVGLVSAASFLAACAPKSVELSSLGGTDTMINIPLDDLGNPANTFNEITNYNNYYEFSTDKQAVARLAEKFHSIPWTLEIGGLVQKPMIFGLEDLLRLEQVERIYRLRCVEGWSMVIPWKGFELNKLLSRVEPLGSAKYVRFTALFDPKQFPGQRSQLYPWPYTEGLRLDEAMHRLTLMATGIYGQTLPNQNGAPLRLVVPWKYGFKSIKAIVKIEFTETMPATLWNTIAPDEYGFYANVNPQVNHPRWSQRTERRIGELTRRETLMFNGYTEEVASLYAGMDLRVNY